MPTGCPNADPAPNADPEPKADPVDAADPKALCPNAPPPVVAGTVVLAGCPNADPEPNADPAEVPVEAPKAEPPKALVVGAVENAPKALFVEAGFPKALVVLVDAGAAKALVGFVDAAGAANAPVELLGAPNALLPKAPPVPLLLPKADPAPKADAFPALAPKADCPKPPIVGADGVTVVVGWENALLEPKAEPEPKALFPNAPPPPLLPNVVAPNDDDAKAGVELLLPKALVVAGVEPNPVEFAAGHAFPDHRDQHSHPRPRERNAKTHLRMTSRLMLVRDVGSGSGHRSDIACGVKDVRFKGFIEAFLRTL